MAELKDNQNHRKVSWIRLLLLTIFSIYFYVFMEWLFLVTKPSFMDLMTTGKKIEVLFITALIITGFCIVCLLALFILSNIPWLSKRWKLFLNVSGFFPAIVFSSASLLMMDNFSYTLFKFGIVLTEGVTRGLYGLLFLFMFGLWYRWITNQLKLQDHISLKGGSFRAQLILCSSILLVSSILALTNIKTQSHFYGAGTAKRINRQPHIILLGGDGINAENMSVYGYERDSTPNLWRLAVNGLLAENVFTNSANSSGSVVSILTGKLPTETGVIYPPDILKDSNAFQHLPGILRTAGYLSVEIGTPYYIDAYELNMQEGFDLVNQRSANQDHLFAFMRNFPFENIDYFIRNLSGRLFERLFHIFYIQKMPDPYREIKGDVVGISDQDRFDQLIDLLENAEQPLFVHVHMLTTHGSRFAPRQQIFSTGQDQNLEWMTDFYDDAILDFDAFVGQIVDQLSELGLQEDTVLIIYTDHNQHYQTDKRIPLIFFFPEGEFKGIIQNNVQNLDIAPTILDYLGLPIPNWMGGQSLIGTEPSPTRRIYSTGVSNSIPNPETGHWEIDPLRSKPPFYQFGFFQVVVCQDLYFIDLKSYEFKFGKVSGHTQPCDDQDIPDSHMIQQEMVNRLKHDGFDVAELETMVFREEIIPAQ